MIKMMCFFMAVLMPLMVVGSYLDVGANPEKIKIVGRTVLDVPKEYVTGQFSNRMNRSGTFSLDGEYSNNKNLINSRDNNINSKNCYFLSVKILQLGYLPQITFKKKKIDIPASYVSIVGEDIEGRRDDQFCECFKYRSNIGTYKMKKGWFKGRIWHCFGVSLFPISYSSMNAKGVSIKTPNYEYPQMSEFIMNDYYIGYSTITASQPFSWEHAYSKTNLTVGNVSIKQATNRPEDFLTSPDYTIIAGEGRVKVYIDGKYECCD